MTHGAHACNVLTHPLFFTMDKKQGRSGPSNNTLNRYGLMGAPNAILNYFFGVQGTFTVISEGQRLTGMDFRSINCTLHPFL